MEQDWFRNTTWNDEIELRFDEKLRRARDKAQYLRIQACTLANANPSVSLKLLERYFELRDHEWDLSSAYVDQATAYEALGEIALAIGSYEKAIEREDEFPTSITRAYLELPALIIRRNCKDRYSQALGVLEKYSNHPTFPTDRFLWHAMVSLISQELGRRGLAIVHAKQALEEVSRTDSGFRNHPKLGLVGDEQQLTIKKLEQILQKR